MAVYLRKSSIANGRKSLYLDIWHNDRRWTEFLKIYLVKARTNADAQQNKEALELAKKIAADRLIELQSAGTGFIPQFKKNVDFVAYFEDFYAQYNNKDVRLVKGALKYLLLFMEEKKIRQMPMSDLTANFCKKYLEYLTTKVKGETIHNYFQKFRAVVHKAVKDKLIPENYAQGISNKRIGGLKKDILNYDEIRLLAQTKCRNAEVKRAFLFSLNTGLRFCDVKELKWKNIVGDQMKIVQSKVKHSSQSAYLNMYLNGTSLKLLGERGKPESLVFDLPTHNGCIYALKKWVEDAEIKKHITWHCARHSFAVNLLDKEVAGADVKTVADLLGHSNLDNVNIYLRAIDARKRTAVNKLPEIEIP